MDVYSITSEYKGWRQSRIVALGAVTVLGQIQKSEPRAESNGKLGCPQTKLVSISYVLPKLEFTQCYPY